MKSLLKAMSSDLPTPPSKSDQKPQPLMEVRVVPVTPLQQNCTLIWNTASKKCAFIDPGGEVDRLLKVVEDLGLTLEKIWLTHGHLDHAGGANELRERSGVMIEGPHKDDAFLLESIAEQGAKYGLTGAQNCTPDRWLEDGDELDLDGITFNVRHCPGHTPGHVVIYHEEGKLAQVGDVLFKGSVGRTDLPRGNHQQLVDSITGNLWPLGDDMRFIPGHGPMSSFGNERLTNPYVSDLALGKT